MLFNLSYPVISYLINFFNTLFLLRYKPCSKSIFQLKYSVNWWGTGHITINASEKLNNIIFISGCTKFLQAVSLFRNLKIVYPVNYNLFNSGSWVAEITLRQIGKTEVTTEYLAKAANCNSTPCQPNKIQSSARIPSL